MSDIGDVWAQLTSPAKRNLIAKAVPRLDERSALKWEPRYRSDDNINGWDVSAKLRKQISRCSSASRPEDWQTLIPALHKSSNQC